MRRGEIDIWVIRIVHPASFSVWIIGGCQSFEVTVGPGIDSQSEHCHGDEEEYDQAQTVSALAFFNYVVTCVRGMGPYFEAYLLICYLNLNKINLLNKKHFRCI